MAAPLLDSIRHYPFLTDTDVFQVCAVRGTGGEPHPGAIEDAVAQVPRRARKYLAPAVEAAPTARTYPRACPGRALREQMKGPVQADPLFSTYGINTLRQIQQGAW